MEILKIDKKIDKCTMCGCLPKPKCSHLKRGKTNLLLVGESPAKNGWLVSNKAFYDVSGNLQATGKILQNLLKLSGLSIEDIYFTECCKCHIVDRSKLKECSEKCKEFLYEQIKCLDVDVILTMGAFATQIVLKNKIKSFSDYVGKKFQIIIGEREVTVIPIYHCSPINPLAFKGNEQIFIDLKNVIKIR